MPDRPKFVVFCGHKLPNHQHVRRFVIPNLEIFLRTTGIVLNFRIRVILLAMVGNNNNTMNEIFVFLIIYLEN